MLRRQHGSVRKSLLAKERANQKALIRDDDTGVSEAAI